MIKKVPKEQCHDEPKKVCHTKYTQKCDKVPKEKCETVYEDKCTETPKKECATKYKNRCQNVPFEDCQVKTEEQCHYENKCHTHYEMTCKKPKHNPAPDDHHVEQSADPELLFNPNQAEYYGSPQAPPLPPPPTHNPSHPITTKFPQVSTLPPRHRNPNLKFRSRPQYQYYGKPKRHIRHPESDPKEVLEKVVGEEEVTTEFTGFEPDFTSDDYDPKLDSLSFLKRQLKLTGRPPQNRSRVTNRRQLDSLDYGYVKKNCEYQPKTECRQEKTCESVPATKCTTRYETRCDQVPEEECEVKIQHDCQQVPREKCSTIYSEKCHDVPHEACQTQYEKKCRTTYEEVKTFELENHCYWPESQHKDEPCT